MARKGFTPVPAFRLQNSATGVPWYASPELFYYLLILLGFSKASGSQSFENASIVRAPFNAPQTPVSSIELAYAFCDRSELSDGLGPFSTKDPLQKCRNCTAIVHFYLLHSIPLIFFVGWFND